MDRTLFGKVLGEDQSTLVGEQQSVIGKDQLDEAMSILQKYKEGKTALETRVVDDELWWKLRHWDVIRKDGSDTPKPVSAYLFNAITNKHADAMDNYPEPVVLPREKSDEESSKLLSSVLPVIMEYNNFEDTYSLNWWEKLKHGTAVYGVFWNPDKDNGLGDVEIKSVDLLNIFWECGVTDIQKSRNVFITELVDMDLLDQLYPQYKGTWSNNFNVQQYIYDDTVDTTNKAVVVDWYYKVQSPDGRILLQYAKFCGDNLLFATENDPMYRDRGLYADGKYPLIFDTLFPEKGTPVGFGYVTICKDPQMYIDQLSANVMQTSMMSSKRRYFISDASNVNEDEFADWNKSFVHISGELNDTRIREIQTNPVDGATLQVIQNRIEEMKDTASNRDVNSGGTGSGVTAAAAISALQEAGNKASRDMIAQSYRAYTDLCEMVIDRIREFYDVPRAFRITGQIGGQYEYTYMDNSGLVDQPVGMDSMGQELFRKPIFDLKIKAQKKNPFSRMEQNERAKELYQLGFFNPDNAQQSLLCLDMMDFEGIDKMKEQISQGATLLNLVNMLQQENMMLKGTMGINQPLQSPNQPNGTFSQASANGSTEGLASSVMDSQMPRTSYQESLAKRSTPSMDNIPRGASV